MDPITCVPNLFGFILVEPDKNGAKQIRNRVHINLKFYKTSFFLVANSDNRDLTGSYSDSLSHYRLHLCLIIGSFAFRSVGVYAKTLTIMVKKDLKIFGIFYVFVLLMFCSSIYMALRAFSRSSGFNHADVRYN